MIPPLRARTAFFLHGACVAICLAGCGSRGTVSRDDFIDPNELDRRGTVHEEISALSDSLYRAAGAQRVELHRKLAIAYRIVGTPESRVRSIAEIDAALRLSPDDPLLHVEKGLTRRAQRFTGDAVACMEKAIELDPGCFDAWYHLGGIHRDAYLESMCVPELLREATACFRRANAIDGAHADALFYLGLLSLLDGMSAEASRCIGTGERLHPDSPRFPLLAGTALLRSDRFEEASVSFEKALSLMDDGERSVYEEIGALLPEEEARLYGNLDGRNRSEYNRRFWARNDPTPATPLNERRIEHHSRVFLARELLSLPRMGLEGPGTVRGQTLIRYGIPTMIDFSMGEGMDGPFVVWSYLAGDRLFRLYFQDEFLNGNYHIPIDPKFSTLADMTAGILEMIPQMYRYPLPFADLPAALQWAQTRGPGGTTRLEFSIAASSAASPAEERLYTLDLTLFDQDWNRFHVESFEVRADTCAVIERSGASWSVVAFERDLVARELECTAALELRAGSPPARAILTEPILMRGFHGRSLVMSSVRITLADPDGVCTGCLDPIPAFRRGAPVCIAYEAFNLERDDSRRSRYRVSYSIMETEPPGEPGGFRKTLAYMAASVRGGGSRRQPFITNSFERSTEDSQVADRLQIDTGSLGEGRYLLVLEVEDLIAGRSVTDRREFAITESGS